jgi:hypothetical protein
MIVFTGSRGFTSMYAVPSNLSYGPDEPHELPLLKSRRCSTTNRTTRASVVLGKAVAKKKPIVRKTELRRT